MNARRIRRRIDAVEYKGGKCERCDETDRALLQFYGLQWNRVYSLSWKNILARLDQSKLLCSNCAQKERRKDG